MNRTKISDTNNRSRISKLIMFLGMAVVMYYMILSISNLLQMLMNVKLIMSNDGTQSLIFNGLLYLLVVGTGFEAVRNSRKSQYLVLALIAIITIY